MRDYRDSFNEGPEEDGVDTLWWADTTLKEIGNHFQGDDDIYDNESEDIVLRDIQFAQALALTSIAKSLEKLTYSFQVRERY